MSVQAMTWVLERSESRLGDRLVLLSIANHADRFGENAWPSIETIAVEARMSGRQVQRAIRRLEELGELEIAWGEGPNGTHAYRIPALRKAAGRDDKLSPRGGDRLSPPGGDKSDQGGVTNRAETMSEMSPEPSYNPSIEPGKAPEKKSAPDWSAITNLLQPDWDEWLAFRRAEGMPSYRTARVAENLARYPPPVQRAAIQHSMTNRYQGLFPEKFHGSAGNSAHRPSAVERQRAATEAWRRKLATEADG